MKTGFLNLFRRSKYQNIASRFGQMDPKQQECVHEERERFASAAIAFCLEHDKVFQDYFWGAICDGKSGEEVKIQIEPHHWADLLLKSDGLLCVVEIKIDAELRSHQNPTSQAFWNRGEGYGDYLEQECKKYNCNGRYIVLGYRERLNLIKLKGANFDVRQEDWAKLGKNLPETSLTTDLASLLSSFGVWQFTRRKMKNLKLSGKLDHVGKAVELLNLVYKNLGWRAPAVELTGGSDDEWEQLGIYLKAGTERRPIKGLAMKLSQDNKTPQHHPVAWCGFIAPSGQSPQRSVFLYCSKACRSELATRLVEAGFSVDNKLTEDGTTPCAVVDGGHVNLDDLDWFKGVLEAAAKAPQR